ncbi:DUF6194 family protein [Nonomuraea longicatena]
MDEIIDFVDGLDGVLTVSATPDDGSSPEVSWGDTFFFYAPDGVMPTATQPFATVVTKNLPGDELSQLDRPGVFRVNIAVGKEEFARRTGYPAREFPVAGTDPSAADTLMAHPVYGAQGWLAVVNPDEHTGAATLELLRTAYGLARARYERRG